MPDGVNLQQLRIQWKVRVTLLPERWGQQTKFFFKFLGLNSKAKLMELSQQMIPPSQTPQQPRPLFIFLWKKWLSHHPDFDSEWTHSFLLRFRIAHTLANSGCCFCLLWNWSWTSGVTTGIQWGNTSDKDLIVSLLFHIILGCVSLEQTGFRAFESRLFLNAKLEKSGLHQQELIRKW